MITQNKFKDVEKKMETIRKLKHEREIMEEDELKCKEKIVELGKDMLNKEAFVQELQDRIWELQSEEDKLMEKG